MRNKKGFFTIIAWQKADDLVVKIYEITEVTKGYFPKHQLYGLTQQFQRAAVSVAANIAEGSGRKSLAEYIHFLSIAKGSLTEVEYYIHLANRLGYLPQEVYNQLEQMQTSAAKALVGFLRFNQAANSMRIHNDEYRAYYNKKYKEVPKHQHKRALVLTARKLVRLVYALLTKKQLYNLSLDQVVAREPVG